MLNENLRVPKKPKKLKGLGHNIWVGIQLLGIFTLLRLVMLDSGIWLFRIPVYDRALLSVLATGHDLMKSMPRYRIHPSRWFGFERR